MIYEYINDYNINSKTKLQDLGLDWNGANGFCFDESGKVAIVWEEEKGYWCLPGGGRENNETPEETFKRGVREEVQADVDESTLKYFHCVYEKSEKQICFRFICKLKNIENFVPRKNINNFISEIDERKFVSLEDLPKYITWLETSETGKESFEVLKKIEFPSLCYN